jgi:dolichol-phosphate mannosyltransferase
MDTDLQDPPEVISAMVRAWHDDIEADVVYTTRTKREGEHPLKMLVTKIGYRFLKFISYVQLPVDSGDFKLLSRRVVLHILELKEDKPYIRGLIGWIGFRQIPVYYDRDPRFDGAANTKFPVLSRRVIYSWLDRALISFSDEPLKIILIAGFLLSAVSLLYIFVVLFQKLMGWYAPGWPALMCAILFIGGMQLMMLGFTGLYVGAIFRQTRGRPLYIVKEVLRVPDDARNDQKKHPPRRRNDR